MLDLPKFDAAVLDAISKAPGCATYVLRNMMSWPNDQWKVGFWPALQTSTVLRACRRLQKRGLIQESPSAYAVMKCWRLADASDRSRG